MKMSLKIASAIAFVLPVMAEAQTINLLNSGRIASANVLEFNGGLGIKIKGTVQDASIGPVVLSNAAMAIWSDPAAAVKNLKIDGVFVTDTWREGIRIAGNADGVQIQNFNIAMRNIPQTGDQFPEGIALFSGKNIVIRSGSISGFKMVPVGNTYTNGDGIMAERAVTGLTIADVDSSDNSDGGFDLKSVNTTLSNLSGSRNYRNFRFWGTVKATTLTSNDPRNAHLWVGGGADVVIDKFVAKSSTTAMIFYIDGAKSLTVKSCELSVPAGTKLMYKATSSTVVTLGKGCQLP